MLDLACQGSFDTKMDVRGLSAGGAASPDQMMVSDIHAARKSLFTVDQQYLPVVAQINVECRREKGGRDESRDGKAFFAQMSAGASPPVHLPHSVDQNTDRDSALVCP